MLSKGPLNPILSGVPENHLASGHVSKYSVSLFQLAQLTACYRIFLSNTSYAFPNICGVLSFFLTQSKQSSYISSSHLFSPPPPSSLPLSTLHSPEVEGCMTQPNL